MSTPLNIGQQLPDFRLRDQHGHEVCRDDLLGRGPVVLYFYPKDETPGCTAQACSFRDHHDELTAAGAVVVGISADSVASHRRFADRHGLGFILLADPDREVHRAFGVGRTLGLISERLTFVADADGVIRLRFSSQLQARRHVQQVLAFIRAQTAPDHSHPRSAKLV